MRTKHVSLFWRRSLVFWHPLTVSAWAVIAGVLDYLFFMPGEHPLSYFKPLIGVAVVAFPILGFAEYYHRPIWNSRLREVIGSQDLVEEKFYSGKNEMIVFEHKGEVVGVVAIDAKHAGEHLGSVLEKGQERRINAAGAVQIRHLDVDQPIRRHGIGRELLTTALEKHKKVIVHLEAYSKARELFESVGFKHLEYTEPVGLLGRRGEWMRK